MVWWLTIFRETSVRTHEMPRVQRSTSSSFRQRRRCLIAFKLLYFTTVLAVFRTVAAVRRRPGEWLLDIWGTLQAKLIRHIKDIGDDQAYQTSLQVVKVT